MLHMAMLGGLAFVGLPILLHLLMRQKPKRRILPAFRFLVQRAKTNQRKIRLRHLLLLLMRMALLALICLALASLRGRGQVGAVVLLIDTTPEHGSQCRGQDACRRSEGTHLELLAASASDSRVAVLDASDLTQQWSSVEEAREKISKLTVHPGGVPITSALAVAYRMFSDQQDPAGEVASAIERRSM